MTKLTRTFNAIFMSAILLSTLSMHSMEPKKTKQNDVLHLNILRLPDDNGSDSFFEIVLAI